MPPSLSERIAPTLRTEVARKLLAALTDYGGYLDDNTASDSGAFNVEGGVEEEVAKAYDGLSLRTSPGHALYDDLVAVYVGRKNFCHFFVSAIRARVVFAKHHATCFIQPTAVLVSSALLFIFLFSLARNSSMLQVAL